MCTRCRFRRRSNCRRVLRGSKGTTRNGAATVELAVCLPVIVLLVVGSIECCGIIFLKQTVCAAAYEGIRVAVREGTTRAEVEQRCNEVLAVRDVQNAQITIDPTNFDRLDAGQRVTVTVAAPTSSNRVITAQFVRDVNVQSSVVMLKE